MSASEQNWATDYRTRHNLTMQELADKIGVSKSLISLFESGHRLPNVETMVPVICKKLRIRPSRVRPDLSSILK